MTDLYNDKYRIASARLVHWDYSSSASYFVTICTKQRSCSFGHIDSENNMCLSIIGEIVRDEWERTFQERKDMNLIEDVSVIMPNHFHAIVSIGINEYNQEDSSECGSFKSQSNNLSSIIRGFKGAVTSKAQRIEKEFAWQPRFHDHIIRNSGEYDRIVDYIKMNPLRWSEDCYYQ